MQKRDKNSFKPFRPLSEPPCLNSEEIKIFKEQFTLFSEQINMNKLKDALHTQKSHIRGKPVFQFIEKLTIQKSFISFEDYMKNMKQYLNSEEIGTIVSEMLFEKGQISKIEIKELLEDSLNREISSTQMKRIMQQIFENEEQKISRQKIMGIIPFEKNKNYIKQ